MLAGLYVSTAGGLVQQAKLDSVANNVANSDTVGYKRDMPTFMSRLPEMLENPETFPFTNYGYKNMGGGIFMDEMHTKIREQGGIKATGNPYDLAINGQGFFGVGDQDGNKFLTRSGQFMRLSDGRVAHHPSGLYLLDRAGLPVRIPQEGTFEPRTDGSVFFLEGRDPIQLHLVDVPDNSLRRVQKRGQSLFTHPGDDHIENFKGKIEPRALELSTADTLTEMLGQMKARGAYSANMRIISIHNRTLEQVINQVGSVPL